MIRTPPVARPWRSFDRRLTIAGDSSRSSESRRAAAARKSVLAKVEHLPSELTIGAGRVSVPGVDGDRAPDERRFAQLDRVPDDRVEDVMVADDPELLEHVLGQVRATVEEGGQ